MYSGREGLEPSKFLRGRGLRPRPRNGEDEKKMQRMKEDIEADLDSLAKKLRNFCEFASWGGQGQIVEIEVDISEKLAATRSGIKASGHAIKESQRRPGAGNLLTVWCTDIGPGSGADAMVSVEVAKRADHVHVQDEEDRDIVVMYAQLPPVSYPKHEALIGKVLKKVKEIIPPHLLSELLIPSGKILARRDGVTNFVGRRYETPSSSAHDYNMKNGHHGEWGTHSHRAMVGEVLSIVHRIASPSDAPGSKPEVLAYGMGQDIDRTQRDFAAPKKRDLKASRAKATPQSKDVIEDDSSSEGGWSEDEARLEVWCAPPSDPCGPRLAEHPPGDPRGPKGTPPTTAPPLAPTSPRDPPPPPSSPPPPPAPAARNWEWGESAIPGAGRALIFKCDLAPGAKLVPECVYQGWPILDSQSIINQQDGGATHEIRFTGDCVIRCGRDEETPGAQWINTMLKENGKPDDRAINVSWTNRKGRQVATHVTKPVKKNDEGYVRYSRDPSCNAHAMGWSPRKLWCELTPRVKRVVVIGPLGLEQTLTYRI